MLQLEIADFVAIKVLSPAFVCGKIRDVHLQNYCWGGGGVISKEKYHGKFSLKVQIVVRGFVDLFFLLILSDCPYAVSG
jgi:hypothetical protein